MSNPFLEPTNVFLYTLHLKRPAIKTEGPTPAEAAVVKRHWARLLELAATKTLIFAGRILLLGEEGCAHIVFRAGSEHEARAIMESDPVVVEGVMTARLYPFQAMLLTELPQTIPVAG